MNARHPHPWAVLLLLRWAMGIRRLGSLTGWQSPRHRGPVVPRARRRHLGVDSIVLPIGFVAVLAGDVSEQSCGPGAILAQRVQLGRSVPCRPSREFRLGEPKSTLLLSRA